MKLFIEHVLIETRIYFCTYDTNRVSGIRELRNWYIITLIQSINYNNYIMYTTYTFSSKLYTYILYSLI